MDKEKEARLQTLADTVCSMLGVTPYSPMRVYIERAIIYAAENYSADFQDVSKLQLHIERLQEKFTAESCGCSYDDPNDYCRGHSPIIADLRGKLDKIRDILD